MSRTACATLEEELAGEYQSRMQLEQKLHAVQEAAEEQVYIYMIIYIYISIVFYM